MLMQANHFMRLLRHDKCSNTMTCRAILFGHCMNFIISIKAHTPKVTETESAFPPYLTPSSSKSNIFYSSLNK